jgi:hypothetical protein
MDLSDGDKNITEELAAFFSTTVQFPYPVLAIPDIELEKKILSPALNLERDDDGFETPTL